MKAAYYNENDPYAAAWLRNLIAAGHIAPGDVDERSIVDVRAADLAGYAQCHFFAGIGGWSYALRLAAWPDGRRVWTGSCPCQPLSSAGQRKGHADERHLWPAFYGLIAECAPAIVFGEQVASSDGREWLSGIRADLETLGYACGAADLCAAGIGAPHIRQRLYWMANAAGKRLEGAESLRIGLSVEPRSSSSSSSSEVDRMADTAGRNSSPKGLQRGWKHRQRAQDSECVEGLGDAQSEGPQEQWREYRPSGERCRGLVGFAIEVGVPQWNGQTVAIECSDGWRRVSAQSNAFPLAHGIRARMGKLRGAGNAINPQVAAQFIDAVMESI